MAEVKKATEPAKSAGPSKLARAAESGDPAVHQLLARRQTAVMNNDQNSVAAIDKTLREQHAVTAE